MTDLKAYLKRIDFSGEPRLDLETLNAIHRQHLLTIPYENIDIQLHTPVDLDLDRIFNKLVVSNRGGWCYEMNGLFCQSDHGITRALDALQKTCFSGFPEPLPCG